MSRVNTAGLPRVEQEPERCRRKLEAALSYGAPRDSHGNDAAYGASNMQLSRSDA